MSYVNAAGTRVDGAPVIDERYRSTGLMAARRDVRAALDIFDTAADMRPLVDLANGQEDRAYDAMLGLVEGTAAFDTAVDRWEMCRWIATTTHTRYRTLRSRESWARLMGLPVK